MSASTAARAAAFLAALADTANVSASAKAADLGRSTAYDLRRDDPDFAAAWDAAMETGLDALEDEAMRRAKDGVSRFVVSGGKVVMHPETGEPLKEHVFSDALTMFLLRARRPERYKERSAVDLTVAGDLASRIEAGRKRIGEPQT